MSLDNVTIKSATEEHTSLEIDKVPYSELTEVRAIQSLLNSCHGVGLCVVGYDSETYSVVSNALVNLEFVGERTGKC